MRPTSPRQTSPPTDTVEHALGDALDDAALAGVLDDWADEYAAWSAAVAADAGPGPDDVGPLSARELLGVAASLPAVQRGALLARVDLDAIAASDGWAVEEHVRLMATVVAATTALQMRSRLALARTYDRLQADAQALRDERDRAARAAGERVPPRLRVVNHATSSLMKLENVSRPAAENRLAQARDLTTRMPATFALLEQGAISPDHARMIRTEMSELDGETCSRVEQRIDGCADLTPGEAAKAARAAVADVAPEVFEKRHRKARHDRTAWTRPLPNGMAGLTVIGPAEHVALRWLDIDEQARALRKAGDPRTLENLRCDLFLRAPTPPGALLAGVSRVDICTGELVTETWIHEDDEHDDGPEPEPRPPAPPPTGPPPAGSPPRHGTGRRHAARGHAARGRARKKQRRRFQGRPVTTVLVVDLPAYLGATDTPALIQGVGPIPASVARELAHGSEAWFRAAFDDSGVCRDYGRLRMPRQDLRDLVIRAKGVLCACGCGQPATEVDHRHEHQHGGLSNEENLQCLTERCSSEKTDATDTRTGWTPTLLEPGVVRWTSPFGHARNIRLADLGFRGRRRGSAAEARPATPVEDDAPPPL